MARTTAPARWQRVQTLSTPDPGPRPAGPPTGGNPIYDQLSKEWAAAGRTLPGRPDLEWNHLSHFPTPAANPPDPFNGPPPSRRGWLHDDRHPA